MSYILEALKKAQAERQLGSAPTLHAVPVGAAPRAASGTRRRPAWRTPAAVVLAVVVGLALVLAVLAWRVRAPDAKPAAPLATMPAPVATPVSAQPVAPAVMPAPQLAVMPAAVPALVSEPVAAPKPAVARAPRAPTHVAAAVPAAVPAPVALAPPVARASVVAAAAVPEEEKLPSLRELPEAIQRAVPPLAFGGYMYSKNPSDRLLLIDKSLRHEGEEVAPGLVLEKLLPKAALMNYKGYRYRVPY